MWHNKLIINLEAWEAKEPAHFHYLACRQIYRLFNISYLVSKKRKRVENVEKYKASPRYTLAMLQ